LAKALWLKKHDFWPSIVNTGSIVGCGLGKFKSAKGQHKPGANRLYRILLSESAYLIWKICCERLLVRSNEEQWHSPKEIQNCWLHAMNKRLQFDCAMTNRRFEKKALADDVVLQTWSGTLHNEHSLPDNWIQESGVLRNLSPTLFTPLEYSYGEKYFLSGGPYLWVVIPLNS
jgi:ribonuclease HI